MTDDQAERIAKAMESIAGSLLKMANPPRSKRYFRGEEITPGSAAEKAAAGDGGGGSEGGVVLIFHDGEVLRSIAGAAAMIKGKKTG